MTEYVTKKLAEIANFLSDLREKGQLNGSIAFLEYGGKKEVYLISGESVKDLPEGKVTYQEKPLTEDYPILASVEREGVTFKTYLEKDECWEAYLA